MAGGGARDLSGVGAKKFLPLPAEACRFHWVVVPEHVAGPLPVQSLSASFASGLWPLATTRT